MVKTDKKQTANLQQEVIEMVSKDQKVSVKDILGQCRRADLVDVRCVIAKVLKEFGHPVNSIGRALERDRTTILNLFNRVEGRQDLLWMAEKYKKFLK